MKLKSNFLFNSILMLVLASFLVFPIACGDDDDDDDTGTDTEAPVITNFALTSSDPATDVNITFDLEGTDNVAITAWMITETDTQPTADSGEWLANKPSQYALTNPMPTTNVYAWAKDAAGNVSEQTADSTFSLTFEDDQTPEITVFSLTSGDPTGDPNITFDLQGTDNAAITGWMVKETPADPTAADPNWESTKPDSFTLTNFDADKTIYAWAKDGGGNVSASKSLTVRYVDETPPVITDFTLTSATPTTNPNITFTLDGTDNIAITHWLINEVAATPDAGDAGWDVTKPSGYTLSSDGLITVYAWAKDAEDNISNSASFQVQKDTPTCADDTNFTGGLWGTDDTAGDQTGGPDIRNLQYYEEADMMHYRFTYHTDFDESTLADGEAINAYIWMNGNPTPNTHGIMINFKVAMSGTDLVAGMKYSYDSGDWTDVADISDVAVCNESTTDTQIKISIPKHHFETIVTDYVASPPGGGDGTFHSGWQPGIPPCSDADKDDCGKIGVMTSIGGDFDDKLGNDIWTSGTSWDFGTYGADVGWNQVN